MAVDYRKEYPTVDAAIRDLRDNGYKIVTNVKFCNHESKKFTDVLFQQNNYTNRIRKEKEIPWLSFTACERCLTLVQDNREVINLFVGRGKFTNPLRPEMEHKTKLHYMTKQNMCVYVYSFRNAK